MSEPTPKRIEQPTASSWKDTVTGIGGCLLYFAFAFGGVILFVLLLSGVGWIAENVYPWVVLAAEITLFVIVPVGLLLSIFRKSRGIGSIGLFISSYVIGLSLWVWSLIIAYSLAGTSWMIVGLLLGGIGVVPIAFIAALISREWLIAGQILIAAIIVYAIRWFSIFLAERTEFEGQNLEGLREKVLAYRDVVNEQIELDNTLLSACPQMFGEGYGSSGVLICMYADVIAKATIENYRSRCESELFSSTEKIKEAIIETAELAITRLEHNSALDLLKMLYSSLARFLPESQALLVTECNRGRFSADPSHPGLRRSEEADLIEAEVDAEEERLAEEFDQITLELLETELVEAKRNKANIEKELATLLLEISQTSEANDITESEGERKYLDGIAFFETGKKHFMEKNNQEALDCFDKAIENGIEHQVYEMRAMCLQALDWHLDAIDDFDKAISLSPEDANLYFMRSLSESATGDVEGCISDLENAVRLSKTDNEMNRDANNYYKETGWNSATDFYNSYLFTESELSLPESLRQKKKERYSARRKQKE